MKLSYRAIPETGGSVCPEEGSEFEMMNQLGAIPLAIDILEKANIGLWAFELDEGCPPRMYVDTAMLGLIGLTEQVPPEETYHAWYDQIDEGSYGLVADAVEKMTAGEHAEVQYPWHHPDGHTIIVRCGGVRNPQYTRGVRIEGTHQNVSEVLHFDIRDKKATDDLISGFARAYDAVLLADITDGKYRVLTNRYGALGKILGNPSFDSVIADYIEYFVHPAEKSLFYQVFSTVAQTWEKLSVGESHSFEYRSCVEGEYAWCRAILRRLSEEEMLVGFRDCDEEHLAAVVNRKLLGEYDAVYLADLDRDRVRTVRTRMEGSAADRREATAFSELCRSLGETVAPEYRQRWKSFRDPQFVKSYLAEEEHREYVYALSEQQHTMRRVAFDVIDREDGEVKTVLLSFARIDRLSAQAILLRQKVAEQSAFTSYFLAPYESAYYVSFEDQSCQIYKQSERFRSRYAQIPNYVDFLNRFIGSEVHPEDCAEFYALVRPERMRERLAQYPEFSYAYRQLADGGERYCRFQVIRGADDNHAAFGFKDVTEEVRQQKAQEEEQRKNYEIIEILASEYTSVYYIDLTTDGLTPYTMNASTESVFGQIFRSGIYFSDAFRLYVNTLVCQEDRAMMLEAGSAYNILRELADKKSFTTTYRSDVDGTSRYCEMKFVKVGEDKNPRAVALGFADKDEEVRAERQRQVMAARDAAVIAGLSDDFGCVSYVNVHTGEETHYRFDPLLSENVPGWKEIGNFNERVRQLRDTVMHPEDREFFFSEGNSWRVIEEVKQEGVFYRNFRILIDGETRYYQEKIIRDEKDENYVIAGFRSVDEMMKRELAYQAKLEAANRAKTDFLFNMSHDIRTPMNAIIGFTQLAQKYIDEKPRVLDSLGKIESSGNHLLSLINEVLDMSRVEAGKLHSELRAVNITEAATRLIAICQESAELKSIALTFEDRGIVHPIVMADDLHINQIVMNILGNAIKYTPAGGSVRYTIEELTSEAPEYGRYRFLIEDTGIGMSKEYVTRIFDAFSREDKVSASQIQGTGLGMAIVKRLVDYMDGTIEVQSEEGKGTQVSVTLHLLLTEAEKPANGTKKPLALNVSGKRILLVEDNELNREIATELLTDQGIAVETAVNGLEAVEQVKGHEPGYYDYVLMDIQMPLMNGFEATREIRKLPGRDSLPIIALSANAFEEDKQKSLAAGMNDHVAKPIVMAELLEALAGFAQ